MRCGRKPDVTDSKPINIGDVRLEWGGRASRFRAAALLRVHAMSLGTVLLIILVAAMIGALPKWPYSSSWGYLPSLGLSILLAIIVVLVLMGRI
ncbi:DUF3309 domain-containing protein [Inquilinus sp. NPDC058860]|uniref:DUF3309 domain-containing protein n=1 Tax=Inquilinus sp. NPDC058860 TaxID=3346652 RepID=UPI0036A920A5